jgi:hypothetical protein
LLLLSARVPISMRRRFLVFICPALLPSIRRPTIGRRAE